MKLGLVGYSLLASSILPAVAAAMPVTIEPGGYAGEWSVDGATWRTGAATVELAAGRQSLRLGHPSSVPFDVKPDGTVVPVGSTSATGGAGLLVLHSAVVEIDPGTFVGQWSLSRAVAWRTGPTQVGLVLGSCSYLSAGYPGSCLLCVDATGTARDPAGVSAVTTASVPGRRSICRSPSRAARPSSTSRCAACRRASATTVAT